MSDNKDISPWTENDLEMHKKLDKLINDCANWNLSTARAVDLYNCLVWYVNLFKKIEDSQFELVHIKKVDKPKEDFINGPE